MTVSLNNRSDLVEPAARLLRSAIDTGDGGTELQRRFLGLIIDRIWDRPDLDLDSLEPMTPIEAAAMFDDEVARRRLRMMMVPLEMFRAPITDEQVALVDGFALALGGDNEGLRLMRELMKGDTERAVEHLNAAWVLGREQISESTIRARYEEMDTKIDDPELAAEMRRLRSLPRGSLGREYIEFYLAYNFDIPGEGVPNPAFFVRHDMSHLIAGFGPSAQEELALSAFQIGMKDNDAHWMQFLAGLGAYELGIYGSESFEAKTSLFAREGAMELVLSAFVRGAQCTSNYNDAPLLEMAHRSINELREEFGVQPPSVPFPAFTEISTGSMH